MGRVRNAPQTKELTRLITKGPGKIGQDYFPSLKVLRTVIYLAIMLTSSSCRKIGVIITLLNNCKVVFLTTLTSFVQNYLILLRFLPLVTWSSCTLHELSDQGQAAWEQILQQLEINYLSNWVHFTLSGFPGTSHRFAVLLHASQSSLLVKVAKPLVVPSSS